MGFDPHYVRPDGRVSMAEKWALEEQQHKAEEQRMIEDAKADASAVWLLADYLELQRETMGKLIVAEGRVARLRAALQKIVDFEGDPDDMASQAENRIRHIAADALRDYQSTAKEPKV